MEEKTLKDIDKGLLNEVSNLDDIEKGAFNIRKNGKGIERKVTPNVNIVNKEDNSGIDIYVKEDTKVLIKSTSLFGGVENKKKTETNDKSKTIYINAFCMFGGVDIK